MKTFRQRRDEARNKASVRMALEVVEKGGPPCDGCQACCTTHRIEVLDKPHHTACEHQCFAGCALHGTPQKPVECAEYACAYRGGLMPGGEALRPDRSGVVVDLTPLIDFRTGQPCGIATWALFEVWPGAVVSGNGLRILLETVRNARRNGDMDVCVVPFDAPEVRRGVSANVRAWTSARSPQGPGVFNVLDGVHAVRELEVLCGVCVASGGAR